MRDTGGVEFWTLGSLGHEGHAVADLSVRPSLDVRVVQILRSSLHREQGARSLRRPFLFNVGEPLVPLAFL